MKIINYKNPMIIIFSALLLAGPNSYSADLVSYEIWGADQSNSVAGAESPGIDGSYIWVWDSADVKKQIVDGTLAKALGCDGNNIAGSGPCNLKDVFPGTLVEHDGSQATGETLSSLPSFGRLHGMLADPQNRYMNINSFVPGGGYVGIIDGASKQAIALFRVTQTNAPSGDGRSLHMSFWNSDGSALLLANLHGRILERIDITRDVNGKITNANFNRAASLGVASGMTILDQATAFTGNNAHSNTLVSSVSGSYDANALGDLTPAGECKANGCGTGPDAALGGRPGNVIVCPIISNSDKGYITFGGGGLLVADIAATPMTIVGEYAQQVINGAGCGGIQVNNDIWLNAGASAGGSGATQSTFTMYKLDDNAFNSVQSPNLPAPTVVFKDPTNTATIGNLTGEASNDTGQLPGITTRRDAHGATRTLDGKYVHNADRLQNVVEVFSTNNGNAQHIGSYDLTSEDGQGQGTGPCAAKSVSDDQDLPGNDPTPDLMDVTPDGKYLVVALRGPVPVSVSHNAQGSCPGVGIIELKENGASGRLVSVLRTTNIVDNAPQTAPLGGADYNGAEHSDPHGGSVRIKVENNQAHYDSGTELLYLPHTDAGNLGLFNVTMKLMEANPTTFMLLDAMPSLLLGSSSSIYFPASGLLSIPSVLVDESGFNANLNRLDLQSNEFNFILTDFTPASTENQ